MTEVQPDLFPETISIADLDQFVLMLNGWHKRKIADLKHMLELPPGAEMLIEGEEPMLLNGDLHKGFLVGLSFAMDELDTLPFVVEMEEDVPTTV